MIQAARSCLPGNFYLHLILVYSESVSAADFAASYTRILYIICIVCLSFLTLYNFTSSFLSQ